MTMEERGPGGEQGEEGALGLGGAAGAGAAPGDRAEASEQPAAIAAGRHVRVPLAGAARLRIEWHGGDLSLAGVPSLEDAAQVACEGRSGAVVWRAGSEVIVRQQAGHGDGEVRLPVQGAPPIAVSADTGDIEIRHLFCDLDVALGHGDLSITGGAGQLSAQVDNGDTSIAEWQGAVRCTTGTGDVQVERCGGPLRLEAGTGDLEAIDCAGDIVVRAATGDVQLRRHHGGRARVRVTAGDIEVQEGELLGFRLRTGCGDIESTAQLAGPPLAEGGQAGEAMEEASEDDTLPPEGLYALESGSGDVSVVVPADAPVRVEVLAMRGEVDSDVPLVSVGRPGPRGAAQRLVGVQPPAAGGDRLEVCVKTLSGDVEVRARGSGRPYRRGLASAMATRLASAVASSVVPPVVQALSSAVSAAAQGSTEVFKDRAAHELRSAERASEPPNPEAVRQEDELRAILAALAEGRISVAEAEALIDAL